MRKIFKNSMICLMILILSGSVTLFAGCASVSDTLNGVKDDLKGSGQNTAQYAAADFMVRDKDDNIVMLSDNKGKPVVVNFWASWCPPCRSEMDSFNAAYQQYGQDVVFMMVNMTDGTRETKDGAAAFVSEKGYTFPVYFDTESSAAKAYGISPIPLTLFIDANGNEQQRYLGAISDSLLDEYIKGLTEGGN